jgi:hypothetical protein
VTLDPTLEPGEQRWPLLDERASDPPALGSFWRKPPLWPWIRLWNRESGGGYFLMKGQGSSQRPGESFWKTTAFFWHGRFILLGLDFWGFALTQVIFDCMTQRVHFAGPGGCWWVSTQAFSRFVGVCVGASHLRLHDMAGSFYWALISEGSC